MDCEDSVRSRRRPTGGPTTRPSPESPDLRLRKGQTRVERNHAEQNQGLQSRPLQTSHVDGGNEVKFLGVSEKRVQIALSFAKNRSHRFSSCTTHATSQSSSSISGSSDRS